MAGRKSLIIHRKFENDWKLTPEQLEDELTKNPVAPKSLLVFTSPDNPSLIINFQFFFIFNTFQLELFILNKNWRY
jgi:hypothetical protein